MGSHNADPFRTWNPLTRWAPTSFLIGYIYNIYNPYNGLINGWLGLFHPYKWNEITPFITIGSRPTLYTSILLGRVNIHLPGCSISWVPGSMVGSGLTHLKSKIAIFQRRYTFSNPIILDIQQLGGRIASNSTSQLVLHPKFFSTYRCLVATKDAGSQNSWQNPRSAPVIDCVPCLV